MEAGLRKMKRTGEVLAEENRKRVEKRINQA